MKPMLAVLILLMPATFMACGRSSTPESSATAGRGGSPSSAAGSPKGELLWAFDFAASFSSNSPLALGETAGVVVFAAADSIHALDRKTGLRKWSSSLECPHCRWRTPSVGRSAVYIADGEFGVVMAFDLGSGRRLWQCPIPEGSNRGVAGRPVVVGDRVVVSTIDGRYCAIDAAAGTVLWNVPIDQRSSGGESAATPIIRDGKLLAGTWSGNVVAIDPATGAHENRFFGGGTVSCQLLPTRAGLVFSVPGPPMERSRAAHGQLRCFDSSGKPVWSRAQTCSAIEAPPASDGDALYLTCEHPSVWLPDQQKFSNQTWMIHAIDGQTGRDLWAIPLRTGIRPSSPLIVAGRVLCVAANDTIYAFSKQDGSQIWAFGASHDVAGPLAWDGERLYAATERGRLYAIR